MLASLPWPPPLPLARLTCTVCRVFGGRCCLASPRGLAEAAPSSRCSLRCHGLHHRPSPSAVRRTSCVWRLLLPRVPSSRGLTEAVLSPRCSLRCHGPPPLPLAHLTCVASCVFGISHPRVPRPRVSPPRVLSHPPALRTAGGHPDPRNSSPARPLGWCHRAARPATCPLPFLRQVHLHHQRDDRSRLERQIPRLRRGQWRRETASDRMDGGDQQPPHRRHGLRPWRVRLAQATRRD